MSFRKVEELEPGDGEKHIEKVWDVSDWHCISERGSSALQLLKRFLEYLPLAVRITVVEAL